MHNSRQLFAIFLFVMGVANVSFESVASALENTVPARVRRHRTPFIVPISPPQFGMTPELPTRLRASLADSSRNEWQVARKTEFEHPQIPQSLNPLPPSPDSAEIATQSWPSQLQWRPQRNVVVAATEDKPRSKAVGINRPNTSALNDRITVHNLNLAAIEDQLRLRDTWTLEDIEATYDQLTSIEDNRRVWTMYFNLLEPRGQRRIGAPRSLSSCKELLTQRIFETQVTLEINRFAVTKLDLEVARNRLEELSELVQE